ncbi:anion transporter [Aquabacterium sp.]|uniref:anion transporter n=1 Tax=Aquabacterium sp. TaxID=1872578 RepID=UPI002C31A4CE|nr:anion transporter [Aquabacterium sp.]HSW04772.1 anion transporter [Aquabacterium sp.]
MAETLPHGAGTWLVLAVFAIVYLGMILGGLPRLHLDRTGVALLGAIAIVGGGVMTPEQAARAIHLPTILLLFSFMVISAQMRLGGFYAAVTRRMAALPLQPAGLLGAVIAVSAVLSAVFSNDIVCLAVAPVLAEACLRRRLDPVPYLLALACAANIGSAATLIGNPQNMLIGEVLHLPFAGYLLQVLPPVVLSLGVLWAWLAWAQRGRPEILDSAPNERQLALLQAEAPEYDRWQTAKGLVVALALVAVFLFTDWPRDVAALVGAGVLLLSQRFHSSKVMGQVDWELLILFIGLFIVNHALELTGLTAQAVQALAAQGLHLGEPVPLFGATLLLSNLVSNVPAVMLLLPVAQGTHAGPTLALVSTLAGNLLIVGSLANIIVVDAARRAGIAIDWRRHARTGVPVTLLTLALSAGWLAWRA